MEGLPAQSTRPYNLAKSRILSAEGRLGLKLAGLQRFMGRCFRPLDLLRSQWLSVWLPGLPAMS
jgi:hypothetical protein